MSEPLVHLVHRVVAQDFFALDPTRDAFPHIVKFAASDVLTTASIASIVSTTGISMRSHIATGN